MFTVLLSSIPSKVRKCATPSDLLRSEISFSRTCNTLKLILYVLRGPVTLRTIHWLCVCMIAQLHAYWNQHTVFKNEFCHWAFAVDVRYTQKWSQFYLKEIRRSNASQWSQYISFFRTFSTNLRKIKPSWTWRRNLTFLKFVWNKYGHSVLPCWCFKYKVSIHVK